MRIVFLFMLILCSSLITNAQVVGKAYNESVDSAAISVQLSASLRKLVPDATDISWGHLFCTKCPKDGTYSYYQAEFYQGNEQGNIVFNENAQPIAFTMKAELANLPSVVQSAITKRVQKLEQDFQKIHVEITAFNNKEKILYKVAFYIPTEDKKHWTPYDELIITESGSTTKLKGSE